MISFHIGLLMMQQTVQKKHPGSRMQVSGCSSRLKALQKWGSEVQGSLLPLQGKGPTHQEESRISFPSFHTILGGSELWEQGDTAAFKSLSSLIPYWDFFPQSCHSTVKIIAEFDFLVHHPATRQLQSTGCSWFTVMTGTLFTSIISTRKFSLRRNGPLITVHLNCEPQKLC